MTIAQAIEKQTVMFLPGGPKIWYSPEEDLFYEIASGYPVFLGFNDFLSDKWEVEAESENVVVVPKFLRAKLEDNARRLQEQHQP